MTALLDPVLTLIINYGYPVVALCILCGYAGIPVPSDAIIMAAGSFTVDGTLNLFILIPVVIITSLIGDIIGYTIGNKCADWVIGTSRKRFKLSAKKLTHVTEFLDNWGGWSIFLTRWLLTPLAVPINLVAGISGYSFKKFILIALLGESLWAGIYIYLGYLFGANWEMLLDYLDGTPWILVLVMTGSTTLYIAYKMWRKNRSF